MKFEKISGNEWGIILIVAIITTCMGYGLKSCVTPKCTDKVMVQIDTLYVERNEAIIILQDSISRLSYEKIQADEELALLRNANRNLNGRVWAINEYIRTGRFPADSTIRRKFGGHP